MASQNKGKDITRIFFSFFLWMFCMQAYVKYKADDKLRRLFWLIQESISVLVERDDSNMCKTAWLNCSLNVRCSHLSRLQDKWPLSCLPYGFAFHVSKWIITLAEREQLIWLHQAGKGGKRRQKFGGQRETLHGGSSWSLTRWKWCRSNEQHRRLKRACPAGGVKGS